MPTIIYSSRRRTTIMYSTINQIIHNRRNCKSSWIRRKNWRNCSSYRLCRQNGCCTGAARWPRYQLKNCPPWHEHRRMQLLKLSCTSERVKSTQIRLRHGAIVRGTSSSLYLLPITLSVALSDSESRSHLRNLNILPNLQKTYTL